MEKKIKIVMRKTGRKVTDVEEVDGKINYKGVDEIIPIVLIPKDIVYSEIKKILVFNIKKIEGDNFKYYLLGFLWSQLGEEGLPYYHKVFKSYPDYDKDKITKEYKNTRVLMSSHISAQFIRNLNIEVARVMQNLKKIVL